MRVADLAGHSPFAVPLVAVVLVQLAAMVAMLVLMTLHLLNTQATVEMGRHRPYLALPSPMQAAAVEP